ncbi:MAG: hypothetical protein IAE81_22700 [Caldilineaceae bacterium]|jgi:F0F1-type ATP synthase assembly protein I|nr:hypothetical protein [Caldilineaceae bacterium]
MNRKQAHIDWRQLSIALLLTLITPVCIAFILDRWLATFPVLMLIVGLICIPLATVVVMRMVLRELDRVIAEVAPPDHAADEVQNEHDSRLSDVSP